MSQPKILLLKEGTQQTRGKPQIFGNIAACEAIGSIVETTLGPRGMDKLISSGNEGTITNDGATVMRKLNIVHPAGKLLAEISKSQDDEVGDGTTSVVVVAVELLKQAKQFLDDGISPQTVIRGYRKALGIALKRLHEIAVPLNKLKPDQLDDALLKCAKTALSSKLISGHSDFFGKMVVDAVKSLVKVEKEGVASSSLKPGSKSSPSASPKSGSGSPVASGDYEFTLASIDGIGVKKVSGGTLEDSVLVPGVSFKKTFSYAGFELAPKKFANPKIALLNIELELKAEKDNAEVRISPEQYDSIVKAEWSLIYEKLEALVSAGANIVLSRLPIGDLATQYFADRDVFCAGRVDEGDLRRTQAAVGGDVLTTVQGLSAKSFGTCGSFEEKQIGSERWNVFTGCPHARTCTLILRGGANQFLEEAHRSLHDALMIVHRTLGVRRIVAGGGSTEMSLGSFIHEEAARQCAANGVELNIVRAFATALEAIPRNLCKNSGYDAIDILAQLRAEHQSAQRNKKAESAETMSWSGVNCFSGGTMNAMSAYVWEPESVKENFLLSSTEAACLILSIDETVRNQPSKK